MAIYGYIAIYAYMFVYMAIYMAVYGYTWLYAPRNMYLLYLRVWICIWESGLVFGCLDLYAG